MSTLWIARGFGRAPPGLCPAHLVESELSVWSVTSREHTTISKFAVHYVFGAVAGRCFGIKDIRMAHAIFPQQPEMYNRNCRFVLSAKPMVRIFLFDGCLFSH
jgi:hypothetical protein